MSAPGQEGSPRRRRLEPDERREQILQRAIRLFGQRRYAAVSTGDVAVEAGVARGLINHYFGSKRGLYLEVVRRMVLISQDRPPQLPPGSPRQQVDAAVDWLLDAISAHGKTWVAVTGAEGIGDDPEVERILAEADARAAEYLVRLVGLAEIETHTGELRALIRCFGGMVKTAGREWIIRGTLTREQVHFFLAGQLNHLIAEVFPALRERTG